jgi:ATP-dependent Lon protease
MAEKTRTERNTKPKEEETGILPILPVRDTVLFPHAVLPLTVGRESSVQLINSLGEDKTIVVVAQREARVDAPQASDLYTVGTLAVVHKVVKMPNQSLFVFAEGLERVAARIPFRRPFRRRAPRWKRCNEMFLPCSSRSSLALRPCRMSFRP